MNYSASLFIRGWWVVVLLGPLCLLGQVPRFERVVEYGSPVHVNQTAMVLDSADNLYVGGSFQEVVCFADTCLLAINNEREDMYLVSFDPEGQLRWAWVFGGAGIDWVQNVLMSQDRLIVTGNFENSIQIGNTVLTTPAGTRDAVVIALDFSGEILDILQIDSGHLETSAATETGVLALGGWIRGNSMTIANTTLLKDPISSRTPYLARYSWENGLEYIQTFHTDTVMGWGGSVYQVLIDEDRNMYPVIGFSQNLIIGADTFFTTNPNTINRADACLAKLSAEGELLWGKVGLSISKMGLTSEQQLVITGQEEDTIPWGNAEIEPGYHLTLLKGDGEPEWVSQSPEVPPGLFLITDMTISGNRIYSHMMHHGPAEFPDTSYYVEDKVLILRHNASIGNLDWYKEFGEEDVFEFAGNLLVRNDRSLVSAGSFHTHLQNFTYLDSVQVVDQYPFSSSAWHYIGFTGVDTLLGTSLTSQPERVHLTAFPNPTRNHVSITGFIGTQKISIKILDMQGRVIRQKSLEAVDGQVSVDLDHLAAGVYLLQVHSLQHTQLFRVIKQP